MKKTKKTNKKKKKKKKKTRCGHKFWEKRQTAVNKYLQQTKKVITRRRALQLARLKNVYFRCFVEFYCLKKAHKSQNIEKKNESMMFPKLNHRWHATSTQ